MEKDVDIAEMRVKETEYARTIKVLEERLSTKLREEDLFKREVQVKIKELESERYRIRNDWEAERTTRHDQHLSEIDLLKQKHEHDKLQLQEDSELKLNEIKYFYEQEKILLEEKLEKASKQVRMLEMSRDSLGGWEKKEMAAQMAEMTEKYFQEIQMVNENLAEFRR